MNSQDFVAHLKPQMDSLFSLFLKDKKSFLAVMLANGRGKTAKNTQYDWSDLQLAQKAWTTAGSTVTNTTLDAGGATITVVSTSGLVAGMVLRVSVSGIRKGYQLIVKSVTNATTFVVDVYGGTSVSLVAGSTLDLISRPMTENNKSFNTQSAMLPVKKTNYTQIFETSFELSGTALAVDTFTDVNTMDFSMRQALLDIERQLALQAWFGIKKQRDLSTGVNGSFGGLESFIGIVDNVSGTFAKSMIADAIAEIVKAGGIADTIACNVDVARKISALNVGGNNPIVTQQSTTVGSYVMNFLSDIPVAGGLVQNIVIDDSLANNELYIVDKGMVALVPMEGRTISPVDATVNGQDGATIVLRGEYTLEVKGGDFTHAKVTGFTP